MVKDKILETFTALNFRITDKNSPNFFLLLLLANTFVLAPKVLSQSFPTTSVGIVLEIGIPERAEEIRNKLEDKLGECAFNEFQFLSEKRTEDDYYLFIGEDREARAKYEQQPREEKNSSHFKYRGFLERRQTKYGFGNDNLTTLINSTSRVLCTPSEKTRDYLYTPLPFAPRVSPKLRKWWQEDCNSGRGEAAQRPASCRANFGTAMMWYFFFFESGQRRKASSQTNNRPARYAL